MRAFLFSLVGIPLLFVDLVLLATVASPAARLATGDEGWIILGGALCYLLLHFLLRKPERLYLWGHEFSHLLVAKVFFRRIHQFHISSRDGGKVVLDRTNVLIDLAPYIFPIYSVGAGLTAVVFRRTSPWVPDLYLAVASFLFTMHLLFSAEGFVAGQPDLRRSGRLFSGAFVLFFLLLWIPCLLAPGVSNGFHGAAAAYRAWLAAGRTTALHFFDQLRILKDLW